MGVKVTRIKVHNSRVHLELTDHEGEPKPLTADHVIAATGEQVLSDIVSKQGDAVIAHVGTQPDGAMSNVAALTPSSYLTPSSP